MTIQLNTAYETFTWNVWGQVQKHLSHYSLRKHYYPNRMDELDNMEKQLTSSRREAVNRVKKYSLLCFQESTQEERDLFRIYRSELENFVRKEGRQNIINNLPQFIETMIQKETQCFEEIEASQQARIQKKLEEEAVQGLLLLGKKEQQQKTKALQEPQIIRRSARIRSKQ